MFEIHIEQLVPKFILADRNGYALAKAIEAGLNALNAGALKGLETLSDFDSMPEWRLDELAWEYACPYNYRADVDVKRVWIKNAAIYGSLYGTPRAIVEYLGGLYERVTVEESQEYGGDPFHFRVLLEGDWHDANIPFVQSAIEDIKNVRSVLDGIRPGTRFMVGIMGQSEAARFNYPLTGTIPAGLYPGETGSDAETL